MSLVVNFAEKQDAVTWFDMRTQYTIALLKMIGHTGALRGVGDMVKFLAIAFAR